MDEHEDLAVFGDLESQEGMESESEECSSPVVVGDGEAVPLEDLVLIETKLNEVLTLDPNSSESETEGYSTSPSGSDTVVGSEEDDLVFIENKFDTLALELSDLGLRPFPNSGGPGYDDDFDVSSESEISSTPTRSSIEEEPSSSSLSLVADVETESEGIGIKDNSAEPRMNVIYPTEDEVKSSKKQMELAYICLGNGYKRCAAELMLMAYQLNPNIIEDLYDIQHLTPLIAEKFQHLTPLEIIGSLSELLVEKQGTFEEEILCAMIANLRIGFPLFKQGMKYIPTVLELYATGCIEEFWLQESKHCLPSLCIPQQVVIAGYDKVAYRRKVVDWKIYNEEKRRFQQRKILMLDRIRTREQKNLYSPFHGLWLLRWKKQRALKRGKPYQISYPILKKSRKASWGTTKPIYNFNNNKYSSLISGCELSRNAQLYKSFMQLFTELHVKAEPEIPESKLGIVHQLNLQREIERRPSEYKEAFEYIKAFGLSSKIQNQIKSKLEKMLDDAATASMVTLSPIVEA